MAEKTPGAHPSDARPLGSMYAGARNITFGRTGQEWLNARHHRPIMLSGAEVAEWQTRYVQGVVSTRACEFKSRIRHQENMRP